jgi:transcription elongation GreA/GreB family factor
MSRAFIKEDTDIPERNTRRRSAEGLPPGALNYLTARGARLLRERLDKLRGANDRVAAKALERVLASATIVEVPASPPEVVTFGATVSVQAANLALQTYRIVGVAEVGLDDHGVSWVSPTGRALLGTTTGQRVTLNEGDAPVPS